MPVQCLPLFVQFLTDVSGLMQKLANVLVTYESELICDCAVSRFLLFSQYLIYSSYPFLYVQWKIEHSRLC